MIANPEYIVAVDKILIPYSFATCLKNSTKLSTVNSVS